MEMLLKTLQLMCFSLYLEIYFNKKLLCACRNNDIIAAHKLG